MAAKDSYTERFAGWPNRDRLHELSCNRPELVAELRDQREREEPQRRRRERRVDAPNVERRRCTAPDADAELDEIEAAKGAQPQVHPFHLEKERHGAEKNQRREECAAAPMPSAAARPSRRDDVTAIRDMRTELGPGPTAPTRRAPRMPRRAMDADMGQPPWEQ